jgi:apolipoprotein N-acyltransferase
VCTLCLARRIMLRFPQPWAVLAYPLLWCAADTLLAHLHPDGNWGSLAYSQAAFLPALQIVSLAGVAGLVFGCRCCPRCWRPLRCAAGMPCAGPRWARWR